MNGMLRRRPGILPVILILLFTRIPAQAHVSIEGFGAVGNGALHPWVSPAHALVLVGLALMVGQRVPLDLGPPMRVLAVVSAIALVLTTGGWISEIYQPVLLAIALLIGAMVAFEWKTSVRASQLASALAAAGIGLDSVAVPGPPFETIKSLFGTWLAINGVTAYLAICISHGADKAWARTGIRIAGSWIVAISLMVLAFALKK
jgi:hypothetical protein